MNKAYKIRLYPNQVQKELIDKTISCTRFIYNQMLDERIEIYDLLKNDKDSLKKFKSKTEKQYKKMFPFLKDVSSWALQQTRINLEIAFKNFYRKVKQKNSKPGFPKFKSKHKSKLSYRECQIVNHIRIENNKLKLLKLGFVKFRGLSKNFKGKIKSITISKTKTDKYFASILVEQDLDIKQRISNNIIGLDLGLKEFITCSNGEIIGNIKEKFNIINRKIESIQRHLSRKMIRSKRWEKCKLKLNKIYEYRTNFLNHFQWHLSNKLCSENQAIVVEDLNITGMIKNRKVSHAIHNINWGSFLTKLSQKALEYGTTIFKIDRFFPSSKMCSQCGNIKQDLKLSDRIYICDCRNKIDRDLNAAINIRNYYLKENSLEYNDNKHRETIRPKRLYYNLKGSFNEVFTKKLGGI